MSERDVRVVLARLRKEGWSEDTGKGSHVNFRKPERDTISVPTSRKELPKGTYDQIARKAGWK
jgi:predicted RNA binding protein YcfA (HicA-like mRNA interferase family)